MGWIFSKMKLPSLLGMIIVGIVLSPYCLNLVDESILNISGELRQIALVIILTRAGLSLNFSDLKKVGRPEIMSMGIVVWRACPYSCSNIDFNNSTFWSNMR